MQINHENNKFYISYNASFGLLVLLCALILSATMLALINTKFDESLKTPFNLFFCVFIAILLASIPNSIKSIWKNNKDMIWGGNFDGLYLGGEFSKNFFYPWDEVIKATLTERLSYITDEKQYKLNTALIEVKSGKNPLTGNDSNFSGHFDKKKSGTTVIVFEFPENSIYEIHKLLMRYSHEILEVEIVKNLEYEFGK